MKPDDFDSQDEQFRQLATYDGALVESGSTGAFRCTSGPGAKSRRVEVTLTGGPGSPRRLHPIGGAIAGGASALPASSLDSSGS